jgi:hypothetical protein
MACARRDEQLAEPGVARGSEAGWMGKRRRAAFISVRDHRASV